MTSPGNMPTPADGQTCTICGQGLWHPHSKQVSTCERCRQAEEQNRVLTETRNNVSLRWSVAEADETQLQTVFDDQRR